MRIAEEIALMEAEFVPGDVLLTAVAEQEQVHAYQAASWFVRHLTALDELPMFAFNRLLRDFRIISPPWSSDVFHAVADQRPDEVDWDEDQDGYIGGWLSPALEDFFAGTGVKFPAARVAALLNPGQDPGAVASTIAETFQPSPQSLEALRAETLSTKERTTLLTIIAAIAEEAKIQILTPSKSAELIAGLTVAMGTPVAKRTIEEHLKKIPDALERRAR
ncbi:hypothetical protein RD110_07920 [Rhodoferax koreense]|uniref:Uncharacterized protein n=1 Tax=Rhodoferax koreensis TaxID=1842727 RepID=A0A1P8JTN6_9BURK|nr:hypothetical protein [Rhodoferax koreense]APW37130.1 hypothetical protein RD110_07920 [Rhodoferax koreense]